MSSLLQCTDDLLQQKAMQSSHYERLERQLLDRERRRRAVVMTLKQRIADVGRRGNDVVDLRRENRQLADQLAQHALQFAALQCRDAEAQKTRRGAVERLQDGVRSWSGHPAQIVLILQALEWQKKLSTGARKLRRALRSIGQTLQLHRQVCVFHGRCTAVMRWHHTCAACLTVSLRERMQTATQARSAALQEAAEANAQCAGPLTEERFHAERTGVALEAELDLFHAYADNLTDMCEMANEEVAALSSLVDTEADILAEGEAKLEAAVATVTQSADALSVQRETHARAFTDLTQQRQQLTAEIAKAEAVATTTQACVRELTTLRDGTQQHTHKVLRQMLTVDFVLALCDRVHQRCTTQQLAQMSERAAVTQELAQLRTEHATQLRDRQMARAEAARRVETETLLRQEAQLRRAAVDLEGDEWRLLHAQLVRDACRARAAAAEAAAAAREETKRRRQSNGKGGDAVAAPRLPRGKRQRGGDRAATRSSAASRRQRAALEAVNALTLTASQDGRRPSPSISSPTSSSITAGHTARTAYRLVSLKPSLVKRPGSAGAAAAVMGDTTRASSKIAKRAHVASAMSPFMAVMSESDSSFSLMHDSGGAMETGAATATAAAAVTPDNTVKGRGRETPPAVSSLSLSPSPSPRCPAGGRTRIYAPVSTHHHHNNHPTATALPCRRLQAAVDAEVQKTPRSALDTALMAARTPRPVAVANARPVAYKLSPNSGNPSALPTRGGGGLGSTRARTGLFAPPPSAAAVPPPPRAPFSGVGRRRAPPLMPTAGGAADDLFADLFS
ncbi:hypothetical protein ABB37_07225 [Leptomonas pyrrhocoris]|uniref:Uncharacterized protein n=1 Tax=Leptomonas pyrrhocoris TaxID=157538 RepID=A0A0N0VE38_LEPPY|nr:hypothetical protein ABB37_07225 [Leptomonas pyrrhocoris]KPA77344.1 hypothetical protein ABB37_07225 [Leptomonas pyrrhocoris]|eukprot:XP_015655783.1 hypothetical protein ABB37_07225 [Leptomonas pyrrhocoris]